MAKGITDQDVWRAADALLLDGQRPTIERVRQHIGRGSPNTVSPHLDRWFAQLGARIADPQAFRSPAPDTPEPVQALAAQLWQTAQALARGQAEARALQAEALAADALAERDAARAALEAERARAQTLAAERDTLRLARAADQAAQAERVLALTHAAEASATALAQTHTRHAQAQADASARVTQAERRAAADMDRERQARLRAEQLARDERARFEHTLADERAGAQAQFVTQVQALGRMEVRAQALQERLDRIEAERLREGVRARLRERKAAGERPVSRAGTAASRSRP